MSVRRRFPWVSALLAAGLGSAPLPGSETSQAKPLVVNRSEAEVLLFALRLDNVLLTESLPGFPLNGGVVVPLGEFARQLDLAIQVDENRGVAEGFIIQTDRLFRLDIPAGTVTFAGATHPLDKARIEVHQDDIYVDTRELAKWLPLDIAVDARGLMLRVHAREMLPMQQHWARERAAGRLGGRETRPKDLTSVANPYRLADVPMVDETLRLAQASTGSGGHRFTAQSATFATADLLYMQADLYVLATSEGGRPDTRASLGRTDPEACLLGPLRARECFVGDVFDPGLNLVSLPTSGKGVLLSNFPLYRAGSFDRQSFRGNLPPGWEVELYQNGGLVAYQQARADGTYEFLNVPLPYGLQLFRLVFYGPQGQRREEIHRFDVGDNQTPQGEFRYRLVADRPDLQQTPRAHFEGAYGLTPHLSAGWNWAESKLPDGSHHTYQGLALQAFSKALSGEFNVEKDIKGGTAAELALRTGFGPLSLAFKRAQIDGFQSEMFLPVFGLIRDRTGITFNVFAALGKAGFSFQADARRDNLVGGGFVDTLSNRISANYGRFFATNQLTWTRPRWFAASTPSEATGDFLLSQQLARFAVRGEAVYTLGEHRTLTTLNATVETHVLPPYQLQAGLSRDVKTANTRFLAMVNRNEGAFGFGFNLDYSTQTRLSCALTLQVSVGRDPRKRRWYAQAQPLARSGAVSAEVFLDANGNGTRDANEKPIEGAGFFINGSSTAAATDASGSAMLKNLSANQATSFEISPSTLEDPLMRPSGKGYQSVPRPGKAQRLAFPVVVYGEITGTIYRKQGAESKPMPGMDIQLLDGRNQVVKTVRSAYDGFYDLTDIPPGAYTLRTSLAQAQRLGLEAPPARAITLEAQGTILDGLDMTLIAPVPVAADGSQPASTTP